MPHFIIVHLFMLVMGVFSTLGLLWKHLFPSLRRRHTREAVASQARRIAATGHMHHHGPLLVVNRILRWLLRAGVPVSILGNPVFLLTVAGRTSGQPRTFAVDLYERNGRRFLLASHGEGDWVRNLRVAGEGTLRRGRYQQAITAVELSPEAAGALLKEILPSRLASPMRGFVLRRTLGVTADASLDNFISVARRCPVFELKSPDKPSS